jgi:hypothetical protein
LNFIIFKENFEFENYFRILEDKDIYILCKFRTTNHKLPIETGRWNNIDRINRICTKCDSITIGDEYHYIMECEHFSSFRNRFIVTNLRETPNIPKFKQIMSAYQKQNLEKLCKFIRNINKSFACIYCIYVYIYFVFVFVIVYLCLLCTVVYGY